jgi:hypothetical protein
MPRDRENLWGNYEEKSRASVFMVIVFLLWKHFANECNLLPYKIMKWCLGINERGMFAGKVE